MKLRPLVDAALTTVSSLAAAAAIATAPAPAVTDPTMLLRTSATQADAPPAALLGYQQRWVADTAQLKVAEKSRRVGLTWAEASDNVLIAAGQSGSNVFYISATQDMAREYIEACAMWVRVFNYAAGQIGEGIYDDGEDAAGNRKFIKTYEISFPASGHRIVALSSRPTNLRGKQGVVVIDEAAFAQDLAGLLKAAMAMLMWGDKVRIISTHDGVENPFNVLIQEIRAGKRGDATVHRITFNDAVADGLFRRVCFRKKTDWTQEAEDKWAQSARNFYGDDAAEELDVVPSNSSGAYLSLALIEQRMVAANDPMTGPWVVRGKWDDAFAYMSAEVRDRTIELWCEENLGPLLDMLHPGRRHVLGRDFARNRDQSIGVICEEDLDLVRRPRVTYELANCPFSSQEQIDKWIIKRLPRFRGAAYDATGNGGALAEAIAQEHGTAMVEQVKLSDSFYLEHMPKLRAGLQDGTLTDLARDELHQSDLRAIKLVGGVPKIPRKDTSSAAAKAAAAEAGEKQRRHGDFAIALFMAVYAFFREAGEIGFTPIPATGSTFFESRNDNNTWRMRATDDGSDDASERDFDAA